MPSNVENILNAILTGDGSGIQKPASRVEELLFEIYEQGGGGGGDSVIGGIKLTIDENYVMTATLVDKDGKEYGVSDDIDLPLEEMVVDAEYDPQTQKIKLELKNGNYVEFSVAELVSGLQTELSSDNKLNPAYIAYDASHRAVSDTEKNTWNAKQNAISDLEAIRSGAAAGATAVQPATMTEALAAKQNSLSETQLAAVDSGINSTKVGQIETNQENVLYTLNRTGKNLLRELPTQTIDGVTLTNNGDGTYTITRTAPSIGSVSFIFGNNNNGRLTGCKMTGGASGYGLKARTASNEQVNISTDWTTAVTISDTAVGNITVNVDSSENPQGVQIRPFVCDAEMYAKDPSFAKPALPNSDLTRLEAEDRASLAEVVDSGAKNKLQLFTSSSSSSGHITGTSSNGVMSVSFSSISGTEYMKVADNFSLPVGTYVLSGLQEKTSDSSSASTYYLHLEKAGALIINEFGEGAEFTVTNASDSYALYVACTSRATGSPKTVKPMICTKAAFDVSQKFVPYRPSYDLVAMLVPKTMYKTVNFSTANTWTYSGLSFTAPAGSVYLLIASMSWNTGKPTGICIANTSESGSMSTSDILAINETSNSGITCMYQMPADQSVDRTIYVHVKNELASGSSPVRLTVIRLV